MQKNIVKPNRSRYGINYSRKVTGGMLKMVGGPSKDSPKMQMMSY